MSRRYRETYPDQEPLERLPDDDCAYDHREELPVPTKTFEEQREELRKLARRR
jgi:hypothetical protein